MKYFILFGLLATSTIHAQSIADDSLNPKGIIGTYQILMPDQNSKIQNAKVRLNGGGKAELMVDAIDKKIELKNPGANGQIAVVSYDPVKCMLEEENCNQVDKVEVYLMQAKTRAGKVLPLIVIRVWEAGVLSKHALLWNKP